MKNYRNNLLRAVIGVAASLFATLIITPSVMALSQSDANSINNDTVWFLAGGGNNNGSGGCTPTGTGGITPGSGAPDGASFPNLDPSAMANAINTWINQQNPNSELKGLGATIVADGKNSNVNPFLIVAIAKKESSLSDPTDFNVSRGNNSFGRTATSSQPNFQGARLWYKWSSVKASVDNTAPENQNAAGGGDMGAYLRDQYGSQLDSNNLVAMFLEYAPPGENDTTQYIADVKSWINDLVNLTNGSPTGTTPPVIDDCSGGTVTCNSGQSGINKPGITLSTVRQNVVCIAQQELAVWEGQPGYPWAGENSYSETGYLKYSQNRQEEWCSDFATWVYDKAGYPLQPDPNWNIAYVPNVQTVGEQNQSFHWHPEGDGYTPRAGDLAIHGPNHINIFTSFQGGVAQYIGGDQGNGPYPGGSIVSIETGNGYYDNGITGYVSPD